jgi:hypothetical protein
MTETEPALRVTEIDRVFQLLEAAIEDDRLGGAEVNRLVEVLERGLDQLDENPREMAEFVTLLEELVVDPQDVSGEEAQELLDAVEVALAESTTADRSEDLVETIATTVQDPSSVDYEDVEQFQSTLGGTLAELAGPRGLGQLFGVPETTGNSQAGDLDLFRIARLGAALTQRATGNSVESGVRAGTRMAYAAANAESAAELLTQTRALTLEELRQAGVDIGDDQVQWLDQLDDQQRETQSLDREEIQARGQRLLSKSASLGEETEIHPGFQHVLDQLAADEARILRLLATEGPQPSISIYDRGYVPFRTRLVAANLSRMGGDAGCREADQTQVYVRNLQRLGLVEFLDQPIAEMDQYQVLEAQPHIEAAVAEANWPKTVYGMARLTDFGIAFCELLFGKEPAGHQPSSRFWSDGP